MGFYRKDSVIKGTVGGIYWQPNDLQSLPPAGWCDRCGAEVYRHRRRLCGRCCERVRGESGEWRVES